MDKAKEAELCELQDIFGGLEDFIKTQSIARRMVDLLQEKLHEELEASKELAKQIADTIDKQITADIYKASGLPPPKFDPIDPPNVEKDAEF